MSTEGTTVTNGEDSDEDAILQIVDYFDQRRARHQAVIGAYRFIANAAAIRLEQHTEYRIPWCEIGFKIIE